MCKRAVRRLAVSLCALLVIWAGSAAWLLGTAWRTVPRYEATLPDAETTLLILDASAYEELMSVHARPYVFEVRASSGGAAVVFGAEHTKNPEDAQFEQIRARWAELQPTVALIESDLGMLFPAFMDPVREFGEVGMVHALAREANIQTFSWEPPDERVVASAIAQGFTTQQVALRWVLGPYFSNRRFGQPADPIAFVADTFDERIRLPALDGALSDVSQIDEAWSEEFPDGPDWRDVSDEFGLPGFLGAIDLNAVRDQHLVACIADLLKQGERVFVIAGSSHAVKVEPAVRTLVE